MAPNEQTSLLIILAIAALAPLLCEWLPKIRLPLVVLEIGLGILAGPHVLKWADSGPTVQVLSNFGMCFLFFLAGFEIDFQAIRGRPVTLAALGWLVSFAVCLGVGLALQASGLVDSALFVGAALSTTALGALVPILRDARELRTRFGAYVVAAGAMGEFGPILLIATVLASSDGEHSGSVVLMLAFTGIIVAAALVAMKVRPPHLILALQQRMHTSAQLPVRFSILLLAGLVMLARHLGLDSILGALAAGVVVSLTCPGERGEVLRHKLEAIGFGLFVPIFFVSTGLRYDLQALLASGSAWLQLPMFLVLFVLVRGLPVLLVRRDLNPSAQVALALLSSTQLPLVVAITEMGLRSGHLQPETAASLVGAAMASVLLFPMMALAIRRRYAIQSVTSDASAGHPATAVAAAMPASPH